jgi:hypothetical protein
MPFYHIIVPNRISPQTKLMHLWGIQGFDEKEARLFRLPGKLDLYPLDWGRRIQTKKPDNRLMLSMNTMGVHWN